MAKLGKRLKSNNKLGTIRPSRQLPHLLFKLLSYNSLGKARQIQGQMAIG